jgi:nitronate monooxygenase
MMTLQQSTQLRSQQRFLALFKTQVPLKFPLIQAPMAGVQDHRLAVAVSNAGGLGSLPAAMLSLDALRTELTQLSAKTDKPFNVNFFCHTPAVIDDACEQTWRAALKPYYDELGINSGNIPAGAGRAPFSHEAADILEAFKPAVVSFHFGLPAADLLARVKSWQSWGCNIISSATTVEEALWLEAQGVDAVIAQGLEAGGHRGHFLDHDLTRQLGTFALLPQIVQAVKIPVIAAGGICDAAGVAAAFALGAAAVQVGTAYLLCDEATTSPIHRAALKKSVSPMSQNPALEHTALTNLFTGRPARGIVNRIMRELGPLSDKAPAFPLATGAIAPLRAKAESLGSDNFSPLWSGQNASGCREVSAAQMTRSLLMP